MGNVIERAFARIFCAAVAALLGLSSGCALVRERLADEGLAFAAAAIPVAFDRADEGAKALFDREWRPRTGKGFADYDLNGDGALDVREAGMAYAELATRAAGQVLAEKEAGGQPFDPLKDAGPPAGSAALLALMYILRKKFIQNGAGEDVRPKGGRKRA